MARVHSFIMQHALGEFHHESHKYSLSLHNALGKNEKAFDLKDGGLQQQQQAISLSLSQKISHLVKSRAWELHWSNK